MSTTLSRRAALAALLMIPALAGCGKKPGTLKAPEGADPTLFPRRYPSPTTDTTTPRPTTP